jgi:hypothetical protein
MEDGYSQDRLLTDFRGGASAVPGSSKQIISTQAILRREGVPHKGPFSQAVLEESVLVSRLARSDVGQVTVSFRKSFVLENFATDP